jgi:glycosyltransferase involved in cell wall biosynthesis
MKVSILGTRGIPASHGGFETFAEHLALYLSKRGHQVTVYCQNYTREPGYEDDWKGVRRVTLYGAPTPMGSIAFDCAASLHACRRPGIILTLGYNTAILSALYRLSGNVSVMNMDGIEWQREKWRGIQRWWLRLNERAGAILSDRLIADHPEIGNYLGHFARKEKITVIPYEYEAITSADSTLIKSYGLTPDGYALVVARVEPENSLLEIVQAFSRKPRGIKLLMLGRYCPEVNKYHARVMGAAGPEVVFADAVYDKDIVQALRFFARVYIHGHRVGGTNPSLVESLAAGNPVIAHDNRFTRWVAGPEQQYFSGAGDLGPIFDTLLDDRPKLQQMACASRTRHHELFTPEKVLPIYENLLLRLADTAKYRATVGVSATNE